VHLYIIIMYLRRVLPTRTIILARPSLIIRRFVTSRGTIRDLLHWSRRLYNITYYYYLLYTRALWEPHKVTTDRAGRSFLSIVWLTLYCVVLYVHDVLCIIYIYILWLGTHCCVCERVDIIYLSVAIYE